MNWSTLLGLPPVASEHGQHVDDLIIYMHWLMAALFAGWLLYFAYALVRFRRGELEVLVGQGETGGDRRHRGGHGRQTSTPTTSRKKKSNH